MSKPITLFITLLSLAGLAFGQDPRRFTKNVYTSADLDKAPVVTYCELTRNPEMYHEKIVRLRAVYQSGFEMSYLYDKVCSKDAPPKLPKTGLSSETWVWFDELYKSNSKAEVLSSFENLKKQPEQGIDVITVGKFFGPLEHGGYGHMAASAFAFVFIRLEQAIEAQPKEK
jgi:hypothetical protein